MSSILPMLKRVWAFIRRSWFILMVTLVLLLFFIGLGTDTQSLMITAIVILSVTIAGLILQIVLTILKFRSFITYLESHRRIDDSSVARGLNNELVTVRRQLSDLMKDKKCPGLVVLLKNTYIYYNSNTFETFKKHFEDENFTEIVYTFLSKHYDLYKNEVQTIRKRMEEINESSQS